MSSTVETTLSRATRTAPTGTRTAFSAYSTALSSGVLAFSARVAEAFAAAALRRRAWAAWLRERVAAAFLAVVDRLVAAAFRVVVAVVAMLGFTPSEVCSKRSCVRSGYTIEHTFVNHRTTAVTRRVSPQPRGPARHPGPRAPATSAVSRPTTTPG